MFSFAFLVLCLQACLVENVFGLSCLQPPSPSPCSCGVAGGYGGIGGGSVISAGSGSGGYVVPSAPGSYVVPSSPGSSGYSGSGFGYVSVLGDMPVNGNSYIQGTVPVVGVAEFYGTVPAVGSVQISGSCGYGCECY